MAGCLFFRDDLVVSTAKDGRERLGVVKQVGGVEDSEDSSDSESDFSSSDVKKGFVAVEWMTNKRTQIVADNQIKVVDRSCLPRDVVRIENGDQLGTALSTSVTCDAVVTGTRKILKGIDMSDLMPVVDFEVDEIVSHGPWIGRVQEAKEKVILKLTNGARIGVDTENLDDSLVICPRMSDDLDDPYPGQMLSAKGKFFDNVEWISGSQMNFRMRTWYKMVVEQVMVTSVQIKWGARAFSDENEKNAKLMKAKNGSSVDIDEGSSVDAQTQTDTNPAEPPPHVFTTDDLPKLRHLNHFWQGHVWVNDTFRYRINASQARHLNRQEKASTKKSSKALTRRLKKRMDRKFKHSTSEETLSKYANKQQGKDSTSDGSDDSSEDGEEASEGDDEDSECENVQCNITPSSGAQASAEAKEGDIHIVVNNDSDLSIASPVGQVPTILGTMQCRFAECELDFTLSQDNGIHGKKRFLFNIQHPGHSEEKIAKMGKQFKKFIKSVLEKNNNLLNKSSCASLMSQFPLAVRAFLLQNPVIPVTEIYFEYTTDCRRTSGVIDKDGKKEEIEFDGDAEDYSGLNQALQIISEAFDSDDEYNMGSFGKTSHHKCSNVKFHDGQWVTIKVRQTYTRANVQWQDGTVEKNLEAKNLFPAHHVDDNDFCPGDFVVDKRGSTDDSRYGVIVKMDNKNRMAKVQWMKDGMPELTEEVSSYEIADNEDIQFRVSDIVARIGNRYQDKVGNKKNSENDGVGELLKITDQGLLQILWTDGSTSFAHPLDVMNISNDEEENSIFASTASDEESWTTASSGDILNSSEESDVIGDAAEPEAAPDQVEADNRDRGHGEGVVLTRSESGSDSSHGSSEREPDLSDGDTREAVSRFVDDIIGSVSRGIGRSSQTGNVMTSESDNRAPPEESELERVTFDGHEENSSDDLTAKTSLSNTDLIPDESTSSFSMHSATPGTHHFAKRYFDGSSSKSFVRAAQRDLTLLRSSLPAGITVKAYEDRMDLLSVLVEGPHRTPYENGLFAFQIYLSGNYPESPPSVHYISYSPRLNPNLYETGRVCVSLLGTWSGKGSERWTKDSTILQVLLSIQGLILNSEPYYNEAGYEGHRDSAEGVINSRHYNEMVTLRLVEHMASLVKNPPEEFTTEVLEYGVRHVPLLIERVKDMFRESDVAGSNDTLSVSSGSDLGFPLLPLSKGVTLSLKNRLAELENLVKSLDGICNK